VRPAEEFRYVVLAAQREGNRLLAAALRELDLTPAWAETLVILDERSPLTVKELGDLLVCENDHPSRLVDRMARAGLLERTALPSDRRAVHLRLTPAAQVLVAQVRAIEDEMYDFLEQAVPEQSLNTVIFTLSTLVSGQGAGLALERRKQHQADHISPK
jgi:MarR family transcriptional regulator, organic hydroperoxide resistance regulator